MFDMYCFMDKLGHDIVEVNGNWYIVDTCKTPDCGWETGIAQININAMREEWDGDELTAEDIREWGEDFDMGWDVQNYRTKRQAEAGHKRVCKNGRLDEDE